jgi:hypothetical protein
MRYAFTSSLVIWVFSVRTGNIRTYSVRSNVFGSNSITFKYIRKVALSRGESCINHNSMLLHHMAMWAHPSRSNLYNATLTYISQECGRYSFLIDIANYRNPSTYSVDSFLIWGSHRFSGICCVITHNRVGPDTMTIYFLIFSRTTFLENVWIVRW